MSAFLDTILNQDYIKPVFTTENACYEQGAAACNQCYRRDQNPYPVGTALREWWDAGYSGEDDELCGTFNYL